MTTKFMRCKVPIPESNSLTATTTKRIWLTYLGSTLTVLTCVLSSAAILSDFLPSDAIVPRFMLKRDIGLRRLMAIPVG